MAVFEDHDRDLDPILSVAEVVMAGIFLSLVDALLSLVVNLGNFR